MKQTAISAPLIAAAFKPSLALQRGRPTHLTPEIADAMCAAISEEGISDTAAAALMGVSSSAVSRWKQGNEDFEVALGQARALFDLACIREIRTARKPDGTLDWRAQAWLLQRSSPDGYGRPPRRKKEKEEPAAGEGLLSATGANLPENAEPESAATGAEFSRGARFSPASLPSLAGVPALGINLPENAPATAPRLPRRERRAEERRLAKEVARANAR